MGKKSDKILSIPIVNLLYPSKPIIDNAAVLDYVRTILPLSKFLMNEEESFSILHPEHQVQFKEGQMPVQTFVSQGDEKMPLNMPPEYLQQTFDWKEADKAVAAARMQVSVAEMMGQLLEPPARVTVFNAVLRALLEIAPPLAIASVHARRFVDPERLLKGLKAGTTEGKMLPHLNVRFYNISNSPGDMIMDTLGPSTLNLPDLQCHFRNLNPGKVAAKLFDTALYLFEKGPVIEAGNTIEGIDPGQKWKCRFENSLLEPKRNLIDINPGPRFAAGNRHNS